MKKNFLLEISVESLEGALAAERGGADRIELCSDLSVGGLTPQTALLRAVRQQIQIPIFAMIRPRAGGFVYSPAEFTQMKESIAAARDAGASGLALGILKPDRTVDVDHSRELVELARPLPVTFHRAFDECADLSQALEDVVRSGAARILTSGGAATALEGATNIAMLVAASRRTNHNRPRSRHPCGKYFATCEDYKSAGASFRFEQRVASWANGLRKV